MQRAAVPKAVRRVHWALWPGKVAGIGDPSLYSRHAASTGGILARSFPSPRRCDSWCRGFSTSQRGGVALIIGAGEGAGQAIAKRFSKEMTVCLVRRPKPESMAKLDNLVEDIEHQGGSAHACMVGVDARKEEDVINLVQKIEHEIGPVEVCIFNVGANVKFSVLDTTVRVYTKVWEMACLGGFITGRECAKRMVERGRGTIIFTGATASMRGASGFSAFASAKHALRALAQSMARELGPKGVHVCHVVIDGAVDTPWIRENFAKQYEEMKGRGGVVEPEAIAEQYWQLSVQRREAWTHELDIRPWLEKW